MRPPLLKCLLVGVIVTLVYVWPVEFMVYLLTGGFSRLVFNLVLASGFVVGTSAAWIIAAFETRYWERNLHTLPDFATPPPWR